MTDDAASCSCNASTSLGDADVQAEAALMALSESLTAEDANRYFLSKLRIGYLLPWERVGGQYQARVSEGTYYVIRERRGWLRWRYVSVWERGDAQEICPEDSSHRDAARNACEDHHLLGEWRVRETHTYSAPARKCCLLCGGEIRLVPFDPLAPLTEKVVVVFRYRQPTVSGAAHGACAGEQVAHDLTGCPDYSGYEADPTLPAYSDDYDAAGRGRERDALCRHQWLRAADAARDKASGVG